MGANISNNSIGGGQRGRRQRYRPMAEINVTPFVDVMLVLLIVFMVAAPLLTSGVQVDLPKSAAPNLPQDTKPLELSMDQTGAIFLGDTEVALATIAPRLEAIAGENRDLRIYVRADRGLDYGRVMEVIGLINRAGFTKVALVSEQG